MKLNHISMKKYKVAYCGNVADVADEIFLSEHFKLKKVLLRKKRQMLKYLHSVN